MTASERKRREWIAMLSVLVAPMEDAKATAALVKMLPMFVGFPDGAFTAESCEAIAGECKRVPGYSELRDRLGEWWKAHRPAPVLAVPRLTVADELERTAANRASWNDPVAIRASVRLVLASPGRIQLGLGRYLGKCVAIAAPQHLGHVPAEWHPVST